MVQDIFKQNAETAQQLLDKSIEVAAALNAQANRHTGEMFTVDPVYTPYIMKNGDTVSMPALKITRGHNLAIGGIFTPFNEPPVEAIIFNRTGGDALSLAPRNWVLDLSAIPDTQTQMTTLTRFIRGKFATKPRPHKSYGGMIDRIA